MLIGGGFIFFSHSDFRLDAGGAPSWKHELAVETLRAALGNFLELAPEAFTYKAGGVGSPMRFARVDRCAANLPAALAIDIGANAAVSLGVTARALPSGHVLVRLSFEGFRGQGVSRSRPRLYDWVVRDPRWAFLVDELLGYLPTEDEPAAELAQLKEAMCAAHQARLGELRISPPNDKRDVLQQLFVLVRATRGTASRACLHVVLAGSIPEICYRWTEDGGPELHERPILGKIGDLAEEICAEDLRAEGPPEVDRR